MGEDRIFIVVDDDDFNNAICKQILKSVYGNVQIDTFSDPEEGLEFIKKEFKEGGKSAVLFLDINMPVLSGWEFLDRYELFSNEIRDQITIVILSSSVDERDKDKAAERKYIKGFLSKPLNPEKLLSVGV